MHGKADWCLHARSGCAPNNRHASLLESQSAIRSVFLCGRERFPPCSLAGTCVHRPARPSTYRVTFGSARVGSHQDVQYLNPDAFLRIPENNGIAERVGNVANGLVRGPGQWTVDFSLAKKFKLTESMGFTIRLDMFNAFNHVNLSSLNGNVESSDFGTLDSAGSMRQMQLAARFTF